MNEDILIENLKRLLADERFQEGMLDQYGEEIPRPASRQQISEVETRLGFPLPGLLKRIYLEVANGGIGWENGLAGLPPDGWQPEIESFLGALYPGSDSPLVEIQRGVKGFHIPAQIDLEERLLFWPEKLLEITEETSIPGLSFATDCSDANLPVYRSDVLDEGDLRKKNGLHGLPTGWENMTGYVALESPSFADWIASWIEQMSKEYNIPLSGDRYE